MTLTQEQNKNKTEISEDLAKCLVFILCLVIKLA